MTGGSADIPVEGLNTLADGECRELVWGDDDQAGLKAFAVRLNGHVYAYLNACPHLGVSLNWDEGRFLDADGAYIQCAMHGALFDIASGLCVAGPCVGRCLAKLEIEA